MTNQDGFTPAESQPTMELLEGAQAAPPIRRSLMTRLVRGSLYGVLILSASALLAISAVPELANYATFIPDSLAREKGSCHLSSGSCTALDPAALASLEGTPCCPIQAAMNFVSGCCSSSCAQSTEFASISAGKASACCEEGGECPLGLTTTSTDVPQEQPLDEEALAKLPPGEDLAPIVDADDTGEAPAE